MGVYHIIHVICDVQARSLHMNGQNTDMAFLKNMVIRVMTDIPCFITIALGNLCQTIAQMKS